MCTYLYIDKFVICLTFQIDVCFIIFCFWFICIKCACATGTHTRTQIMLTTNTFIYPILNGSRWILAALWYNTIPMHIYFEMVRSLTCIHIVYCLRNLLHLIYRPSTTNQILILFGWLHGWFAATAAAAPVLFKSLHRCFILSMALPFTLEASPTLKYMERKAKKPKD